jgi:16S rRNA (adenine1518-N6/adenine1519-N6)-dimethyltransferase
MEIKALLRELQLRPQKQLGQNFLVDRRVLKQILAVAEIGSEDTVLEVGSGLGTLTQALAEQAQRVVAVEVDERLVAILRQRLEAFPNTEIVLGDILALDIAGLVQEESAHDVPSYKVVANIPYYITSAVLRHLLEASVRPQLIVLMVQREVAQRIVAKPGQMSLLAVSVQFYGQPRLVSRVSARSFYPVPKVDSAIVRIDPHEYLPLHDSDITPFFDVVRAGFAQRRKQLRNALVHGLALPAEHIVQAMASAGIDRRRRAQTLSVREWVALYRALGSMGNWEIDQANGSD